MTAERVFTILSGLFLLSAAVLLWWNNLTAAFVTATLGIVAWFLSFRAQARAMYTNSAGEMVRRLAEKLERAMDAGELRRDDPRFAAEMLLSMLAGIDRMKKLFSVNDAGESEARRTGRIVDCFLRAYEK